MPASQTAVIAADNGGFQVSNHVHVPHPEPDEILIKTAAVALNPVDAKMAGNFVTPGCIYGFDCAGMVVAVGSVVTKDWRVGDRVCGAASGMNQKKPLGGAFAEYALLPANFTLRVPDGMAFENAAALGTTVLWHQRAWHSSGPVACQSPRSTRRLRHPVRVYWSTEAVQLPVPWSSSFCIC